MAWAINPDMPNVSARSLGSARVASPRNGIPVTITKTNGIRNVKQRKARAAARTPPPVRASRSIATNAASIQRLAGRRRSRC